MKRNTTIHLLVLVLHAILITSCNRNVENVTLNNSILEGEWSIAHNEKDSAILRFFNDNVVETLMLRAHSFIKRDESGKIVERRGKIANEIAYGSYSISAKKHSDGTIQDCILLTRDTLKNSSLPFTLRNDTLFIQGVYSNYYIKVKE